MRFFSALLKGNYRIEKKVSEIVICFMIIIACCNIIPTEAVEEQPLVAAITNISWATVDYAFLNENYSNFGLMIDFDIFNPNNENVTLAFPNSSWRFYFDMNVTFRNRKFELMDYTSFTGLSVVTSENFTSGINSRTQPYFIGINEKDLTDLPDGSYYLTIKSRNIDDSIVISNLTKLYIRDGNPTIIYDYTGPTVNLAISFGSVFFSSVLFMYCVILIKHKIRKQLW